MRLLARSCLHPRVVVAVASLWSGFAAFAQPASVPPASQRSGAAPGVITGRVLNANSGNYLNRARVAVEGTSLQTFTDENGNYRLGGVPAGEVRLSAAFTGLAAQSALVTISAGGVVQKDFDLALPRMDSETDKGVVTLSAFTVQERELTGQAVALHEQRTAPNIKNVVAIDVDTGEGNVGEFLKYIPGIVMEQSPQTPQFANIRGMPASGTLVTTNGMEIAANGIVGRATDLGLSATGNIDRIEVTKVPTPDMPANAVGGGINMVTKSGFSRKKPLLTYNIYGTVSTLDGLSGPGPITGKSDGPDNRSNVQRLNPSFNLSYLHPINRSFALALSASKSMRYNDWQFPAPAWDKVNLRLVTDTINHLNIGEEKELGAATLDWKISANDTLSLSASHSNQEIFVRQNRVISTFGAGATGGPTFAAGAPTGVGTATMSPTGNNQYKDLSLVSLSYRHTGAVWKIDANLSRSAAGTKFTDTEDRIFNNVSARIANITLRHDGIDQVVDRRIAAVTATDRTGAPVNIYDISAHSIVSTGSAPQDITDEVRRAGVNVSRDFDVKFPLTLKVGAIVNQRTNDTVAGSKSWTFAPPGGAAATLARNYDVVAQNFSRHSYFVDARNRDVAVSWPSMAKVYELYAAHPEWFVLNEPAAYMSEVNLTKTIEETITAGYFRADAKLFDNRMWIVSGVRYERTDDEGWGPLNDIRATYVRTANGDLVRDSAGRLIPITTNALQRAQLQYTLKGAYTKRNYGDFYPSMNASFSITPTIVVRAAYARTIGRPNFPEIIPGMTVTDPDSSTTNKVITVINSALKPWTANNYDLSFEVYEVKGAVASASLFQKDLKDFFGSTREDATVEKLADFGFSDDYLDYDIVTKRNIGSATISGVELSYRQSLGALQPWAKGLQVFGNVTLMDLSGPNAADLTGFSPRTIQWGVSYARSKFSARVNVNQNKWRRNTPTAASATVRANSYNYFAPQVKVDATVSYMFNRHYSVYLDARNISGTPQRRGTWSPDTPAYARIDILQYPAAAFTLGIKGDF
ncbi:TonB-dependent receptor [Horticoccus sp. 23ND18S-11]|uniref:TonB-dependent receptor n=1 Tax=Horticoccus sp. 23ND18S-11 TaxID=3391832 RepID=UPI0039C9577F